MEVLNHVINFSNNFFGDLIDKAGIQARHYEGVYPDSVTPEYLQGLIAQGQFPSVRGFAPAFTYFILLSVIRYVLQNYIVKPVAARLMKIKLRPFTANKKIDKVIPWKSKAIVGQTQIADAAKVLGDVSVDEVSRYVWERKVSKIHHMKIVKFVEAFWRAIFYSGFTYFGYNALFRPTTAIWVWNNEHHFENWPHELTPALDFYYQIQLGCYFHQLLWTEVSRSDAAEMIAHHFITIILIAASYLSGFFRIGSSILFLHDIADIVLETGKVLNYCSKPVGQRWLKSWVVDPVFALFAITFFVTRLVFYPKNILWSVFADGYRIFDCNWGGCGSFVGLLFALQFLHIFWFFLIVRMIVKLAMGTFVDDERSDNEDDELENEPSIVEVKSSENAKKKKKNKGKQN